jgi:hypothetical protein
MVLGRLKALRELSPATLQALPEYQDTTVEVRGREQIIATWRQPLPAGRTLIVVQAKREVALGFGFMHAEGLIVTSAGAFEDPEPDLMYEYT